MWPAFLFLLYEQLHIPVDSLHDSSDHKTFFYSYIHTLYINVVIKEFRRIRQNLRSHMRI